MKNKAKDKIIGGVFGLPGTYCKPKSKAPFLNRSNLFLANASSGIWLLNNLLSPAQVWMPSYLCNALLLAVDTTKTAVRFYEVDSHLQISSLEWLTLIKPNDLIIFIDYFGFPCNRALLKNAKDKGAWILEDASQALLSEDVGKFSDFTLFSPRKFLGVPDGGILSFNERNIKIRDIKLSRPPDKWWLKAFSATLLRRDFDLYGVSNNWFELFQEAEAEVPVGNYAMSEFSQTLLNQCFDFSTIAQIRVENYNCLAKWLSKLAIFPDLLPGVIPLGFPIITKNRDQIRQALFGHHIYPPVHWNIKGVIPEHFEQSHELSNRIMTLPCDQRYNILDMERIAKLINET